MNTESVARRDLLKNLSVGAATVAAGAAIGVGSASEANNHGEDLETSPFRWPYEDAIRTNIDGRAVMACPSLSNVGTYFAQAGNWLNSIQRDYGYDPEKMRLVMANYGPMNFITYNDSIWQEYRVGEWQQVTDPITHLPAVRNPFLAQIGALQARHCVFLT
jgi:hypothetical protein